MNDGKHRAVDVDFMLFIYSTQTTITAQVNILYNNADFFEEFIQATVISTYAQYTQIVAQSAGFLLLEYPISYHALTPIFKI